MALDRVDHLLISLIRCACYKSENKRKFFTSHLVRTAVSTVASTHTAVSTVALLHASLPAPCRWAPPQKTAGKRCTSRQVSADDTCPPPLPLPPQIFTAAGLPALFLFVSPCGKYRLPSTMMAPITSVCG